MRVLVLGAYGLIGLVVADGLLAAGWRVVGLGRSVDAARRMRPEIDWRSADIARLRRPDDWTELLEGVDAIVNCAGALQNGARDDVAAVHRDAIKALILAAEAAKIERFVQISAAGASTSAPTLFMRTKGEADAALAASRLCWVVLRPGLVIGPAAYGGTALLRGLANLPLVTPIVAGAASIQTVAVEDVADAVRAVLAGEVHSHAVYDLVEDDAHSLAAVVAAWRRALGRPPVPTLGAPPWLGRLFFRAGDLAGWFGWRPPMRTAALDLIAAGVRGDPGPWRSAGGRPIASLTTTLRRLPSSAQERLFGRLVLLKPIVIVTLAGFWIASGAIGLLRLDQAAEILVSRGTPEWLATVAALLGGLLDAALGFAILFRRAFVVAACGMVAASAIYLLGAIVLAPDLWLDPLGPMVKTIPAAVLAIVALAMADER